MKEMELYALWKSKELEDTELTKELAEIEGQTDEIKDRFYKELEFGTGGLRGVIGAGTNRMNIYTVRLATQGLANYLNDKYEACSVAVSYDSRIKSDLFAKEAARVLAANGIKAYLTCELMPTPMLSYITRKMGCKAGIMITASHNPAKYNGYKAYGPDGCQLTLEAADEVLRRIQELDIFNDVKISDFYAMTQTGRIELVGKEIYRDYLSKVCEQRVNPHVFEGCDLKVVYTPLNGTGNIPVRMVLDRAGLKQVEVVKEQELPDGNFTTCSYPNPEFREALALGLKLCEEVRPDILLATDPDCDRVGTAIAHNGEYVLLSGNEIGALLLNYILECRTAAGTMPKNPVTVKTIVTTKIVDAIAAKYGTEVVDVLTGFKFIGEQIARLEAMGEEKRYVFGFEESYGYLAGTYVRDKDAVVASLLICEMTAHYKKQGKTLVDKMEDLYAEHGRYLNTQDNFAFEGEAGMHRMDEMMNALRESRPCAVAGLRVLAFLDYQTSKGVRVSESGAEESFAITLPSSNVLEFDLENNASVIVRPSGTEPKIKLYYTAKGKDLSEAQNLATALSDEMKKLLGI